jgi:phospholipid-binding lipoprotein MlaA
MMPKGLRKMKASAMKNHAQPLASRALGAALLLALASSSAFASSLLPSLPTEIPGMAAIPTPPPAPDGDIPADMSMADAPSDPLEPINRLVFGLNEGVDFLILRPVNTVYRTLVPQPVRKGVANVVYNLASPVILANDILQGEGKRAGNTASRFLINTTVGVGGFVDVAAKQGIPRHSEDFGQTLAVWGIGSGPYIVLPLIGPSTLRDTAAMVVDGTIDPMTWALMHEKTSVRLIPTGTQVIVYHDEYLDVAQNMRRSSADFYASVRDVYAQRRQSEIANGNLMLEPLPPISGD